MSRLSILPSLRHGVNFLAANPWLGMTVTPITEEVLASIRKLIRASDVYSSKVRQLSGLTSAQLLLLRAVDSNPSASLGELARKISLSQATTSTILKRLESAGFTYTTKSENDRRRSQVFLTESGAEALVRAPKPLDQEFLDRFASLKPYEQSAIVSSLQRVAEMMGDDAPVASDAPLPLILTQPDCFHFLRSIVNWLA